VAAALLKGLAENPLPIPYDLSENENREEWDFSLNQKPPLEKGGFFVE
jgi:hypothetical protein